MSKLINWCSIQPGAILYLADSFGYRNHSEKNYVYAPSLPDFVVVDAVRVTEENGWQIDFVGFPYKKGAITQADDDDIFFAHVGDIDDHGEFDIDYIRSEPYVFSKYYKAGGHLRSDNGTVLYLDSILANMATFDKTTEANKAELNRLFTEYLKRGTFVVSDIAYITNRLISAMHQTMIKHHEGDVAQSMERVRKLIAEQSQKMDRNK